MWVVNREPFQNIGTNVHSSILSEDNLDRLMWCINDDDCATLLVGSLLTSYVQLFVSHPSTFDVVLVGDGLAILHPAVEVSLEGNSTDDPLNLAVF